MEVSSVATDDGGVLTTVTVSTFCISIYQPSTPTSVMNNPLLAIQVSHSTRLGVPTLLMHASRVSTGP